MVKKSIDNQQSMFNEIMILKQGFNKPVEPKLPLKTLDNLLDNDQIKSNNSKRTFSSGKLSNVRRANDFLLENLTDRRNDNYNELQE